MKILVTPTSMQPGKKSAHLEKLREAGYDLVFNPSGRPLSGNSLIRLLQDCDGYLAGLDFVTADVLGQCPKLKAISRYGAGYDRVDTTAAATLHIPVSNTPGANAQAVAELTFGMLLALARGIPYLHRETIAGKWIRSEGTELFGKTLGIVGLGAIGRRLASCCRGFDMKLLTYDPCADESYCCSHGIQSVSLEQLLHESDFVTLHLPLTVSTWHMINADAIAAMKYGAVLVNASRGGIVDEKAAYEALISGRLGGLGLDAFEQEPPEITPLFFLPNVVITPHAGAHTSEAAQKMAQMAVQNLLDMLEGKECRYIINGVQVSKIF